MFIPFAKPQYVRPLLRALAVLIAGAGFFLSNGCATSKFKCSAFREPYTPCTMPRKVYPASLDVNFPGMDTDKMLNSIRELGYRYYPEVFAASLDEDTVPVEIDFRFHQAKPHIEYILLLENPTLAVVYGLLPGPMPNDYSFNVGLNFKDPNEKSLYRSKREMVIHENGWICILSPLALIPPPGEMDAPPGYPKKHINPLFEASEVQRYYALCVARLIANEVSYNNCQ